MSTAPAGIPSDPPQRTSHQPGTLAVLTATAIGGVLATRLGKAPLVLAAGAAAYALFKQKHATAPTAMPPPPPAPQQETPALNQVEQWLSRQITREQQTPLIDFSSTEATAHEPEDDYYPQSLLLDDMEEYSHHPPSIDSFARLTEPVPQQESADVTPFEQAPAPAAQIAPEPDLPPPQIQETPPLVAADAAWTLGVEPLPSLNETPPAPFTTLASSMFFTAPVQHEDLEPPPVFTLPVFEGAAFPDQIDVAPHCEPTAFEPVAHQTPAPEPVDEPPPLVETSPEIPVQLAAPGEASFDPPLAALTQNPWEPEPDVPVIKAPALPPSQLNSPLVDAEIILRPRAPMQHSVAAKSKHSPPDSFKKDFAESFDTALAAKPNDVPSAPPQLPTREPRSRPSWRSWWRDD